MSYRASHHQTTSLMLFAQILRSIARDRFSKVINRSRVFFFFNSCLFVCLCAWARYKIILTYFFSICFSFFSLSLCKYFVLEKYGTRIQTFFKCKIIFFPVVFGKWFLSVFIDYMIFTDLFIWKENLIHRKSYTLTIIEISCDL